MTACIFFSSLRDCLCVCICVCDAHFALGASLVVYAASGFLLQRLVSWDIPQLLSTNARWRRRNTSSASHRNTVHANRSTSRVRLWTRVTERTSVGLNEWAQERDRERHREKMQMKKKILNVNRIGVQLLNNIQILSRFCPDAATLPFLYSILIALHFEYTERASLLLMWPFPFSLSFFPFFLSLCRSHCGKYLLFSISVHFVSPFSLLVPAFYHFSGSLFVYLNLS